MAKLTGRLILEKYSPGKKRNSFYEEQEMDQREWKYVGESTGDPQSVYYIDKTSGTFKAKNTLLLG